MSKHNNSGELEEYKMAVVGGGAVGKSACTVQFVQSIFVSDYDPTIEDSYRKHCRVDDKPCYLEILDTAGQEEYRALRDAYMRSAECFMLVFSIIDRKSFQEVDEYCEQILRVKDVDAGQVPMILVGNKADLESERAITSYEAEQYARERKMMCMECSARKRLNIDECFHALVKDMRALRKPVDNTPPKKRRMCSIM